MISSDAPLPGYRPCVGLMLMNRAGLIFTGQRLDTPGDAWQMPQGGIDKGETPRDAALRELREETGTGDATILAESRRWHSYDLPRDLQKILWGGRYAGQTQKWFLLRFNGTDGDIDLDGDHPEFREWRWMKSSELLTSIVAFKREIYAQAVAEFTDLIAPEEA